MNARTARRNLCSAVLTSPPLLLLERALLAEQPNATSEAGPLPTRHRRGVVAAPKLLHGLPGGRVRRLHQLEVAAVLLGIERPLMHSELGRHHMPVGAIPFQPRQRISLLPKQTQRRLLVVAGRRDRDHLPVTAAKPV